METKFSQKGVSLLLTVVIMAMILAMVLGLGAILIGQMRIVSAGQDSVDALYAADTGIERALKDAYDYFKDGTSNLSPDYPLTCLNQGGTPPNCSDKGAYYHVTVVCSDKFSSCPLGAGNIDASCQGNYFCVKSAGTYNKTQRAIEVEL